MRQGGRTGNRCIHQGDITMARTQGTIRTTTRHRHASALGRLPLATAIYLALGSAWAQDATPPPATPPVDPATTTATKPATAGARTATLGKVTVTAQKRVEDVQDVPISMQVLGQQKLEQENISDFDDFAQLLPSVSFGASGGGVFPGPGFLSVFMRGVASGDNANHSGPAPSVGMYLDEQPITTVTGALDVHIYDVARIEALAGPQGTLYGASSQAGTVRIITNKPDPSAQSSGYSLEANAIEGGGIGHVEEGFANIPIGDNMAVRLVGWNEHKAGWVDNVAGTRTFPNSGVTIDNFDRAEDNYNQSDITGVRAALRIDLDNDWSITPGVMSQRQRSDGSTAFNANVGDLELTHFYPETSDDEWLQAALTVQGRVGNFDLVYAYSHLNRNVDSQSDYNDYGFWYDTLFEYVNYDDEGNTINPSQHIDAHDGYRKTSHEIRLSSDADNRVRFVGGFFWQEQDHDILQRYLVDGLGTSSEVNGWPDTIWLTAQKRKDHEHAVFGELSVDLTEHLIATGGMRFTTTRNSLRGFFGYGDGFSGSTGVAACFSPESIFDAPCLNLDKHVEEDSHVGKFNLTWKFDPAKMVYVTWSEGFRPGGNNRRGTQPAFVSDFLTNYEFGWKTSWGNRLTWNGAIFREDWDNFQFSFLGANGLTEIRNAPKAKINGIETDLNWAVSYNFTVSGGFAWYDAKLVGNYCEDVGDDGNPVSDCESPRAFDGDRLPVTPEFKGNVTGRYTFDIGANEGFVQATVVHVGEREVDLRKTERAIVGDLDAYTLVDLSAGIHHANWSLDLFLKNAFDERAELGKFTACKISVCGGDTYTIAAQPRTFGVRFTQEF
jgi:outer membrane receptor protein involved in Fe transport